MLTVLQAETRYQCDHCSRGAFKAHSTFFYSWRKQSDEDFPTTTHRRIAGSNARNKPSAKVAQKKAVYSSQRQSRATLRNASHVPATEERVRRQWFRLRCAN